MIIIVIAIVDLLAAIFIGGSTGFSAAFIDVVLILLGYKEYSDRSPMDNKKEGKQKNISY